MSGRRAIYVAINCIASSAGIFPVKFDQITEPFFSQGMCHDIATCYCHKHPDLGLLLVLFPVMTLHMPFGRCQRLWTASDLKYLVVPPYNCGVGAETVP